MINRILRIGAAMAIAALPAPCQQTPSEPDQNPESKHVFWIIPNYRTSPILATYEPLTVKEKFKVAGEDSWDRGTFALAAVLGAQDQLLNSNRAFGQGAAGYGRYLGGAYGDFVIGNYMTEGLFPAILHQDPRYFRRGTGSGWSRLGYAMGQIIRTHNDSGATQFNYSEIVGNSVAVAISNSYYVDNRNVRDNVSQLGVQIGVDMAANILKEFWPDLDRKLRHKQKNDLSAVK